jgi:hypothetical protein
VHRGNGNDDARVLNWNKPNSMVQSDMDDLTTIITLIDCVKSCHLRQDVPATFGGWCRKS